MSLQPPEQSSGTVRPCLKTNKTEAECVRWETWETPSLFQSFSNSMTSLFSRPSFLPFDPVKELWYRHCINREVRFWPWSLWPSLFFFVFIFFWLSLFFLLCPSSTLPFRRSLPLPRPIPTPRKAAKALLSLPFPPWSSWSGTLVAAGDRQGLDAQDNLRVTVIMRCCVPKAHKSLLTPCSSSG